MINKNVTVLLVTTTAQLMCWPNWFFSTIVIKYQHFFRTNAQFQDFSGPDFSFFIFQDFAGLFRTHGNPELDIFVTLSDKMSQVIDESWQNERTHGCSSNLQILWIPRWSWKIYRLAHNVWITTKKYAPWCFCGPSHQWLMLQHWQWTAASVIRMHHR